MKRVVLPVLLALSLAACGSTVQVKGQATVGDGVSTIPGGTTAQGGLGAVPAAGSGQLGPGGGLAASTTGGTAGGPTGGSTTGGSTGAAVPTGRSGATVASRQPIQIGFIATSVGNAAALGVNAGQSYTDRDGITAIVQEYNAQGGLAGHKIEPVFGDTDTASTNWENEFARACSTFTQDNYVKAVIGYIFVFLPSFENCLAKAKVPHLYGGYQPGDVAAQRAFPTLVSTAHPTVDGFNLAVLEGALASGRLTKRTKLGILLDTCANGDRAYRSSTEPWLKAHGVDYQYVQMDCAQGSGDASSGAATVSNAELRFSQTGVDTVFAFGVALLVFMEDAESQNYHPQYLTGVGGAALEANAPAAQMVNVHGYGWLPSVDVNPGHQPYPQTAAQKACVAKLVKHGLRPTAYNDFMAAYQLCDGLELYARALERTGGSTEATGIVSALESSMPAFLGAGTYGGRFVVGPRQRGGASTYRETGWTDSCSCMTYRGPTRPMPIP